MYQVKYPLQYNLLRESEKKRHLLEMALFLFCPDLG